MILIAEINSNVKIRLLKIIIVKGRGMSPASFGAKNYFFSTFQRCTTPVG